MMGVVAYPKITELEKISGITQSPFDLKEEIQRFQLRRIDARYGIDFTWSASGTSVPANSYVEPLNISGSGAIYLVEFRTTISTYLFHCMTLFDGQELFCWQRTPDYFERAFLGESMPALPIKIGGAELIRYDATNSRYIIVFKPYLIQGGIFKSSGIVRLQNTSTTDAYDGTVYINYGIPSSFIKKYIKSTTKDSYTIRTELAQLLQLPIKLVTITKGVDVDENDNIYDFIEVSVSVDVDEKVIDDYVGGFKDA